MAGISFHTSSASWEGVLIARPKLRYVIGVGPRCLSAFIDADKGVYHPGSTCCAVVSSAVNVVADAKPCGMPFTV